MKLIKYSPEWFENKLKQILHQPLSSKKKLQKIHSLIILKKSKEEKG